MHRPEAPRRSCIDRGVRRLEERARVAQQWPSGDRSAGLASNKAMVRGDAVPGN
jgi:hypothetical protein